MKKSTFLILVFLIILPVASFAQTNEVSICDFLDDTGYGTAFNLDCNPLWLTNLVFYVRSGDLADPGTNRIAVWQGDGSGFGSAGDICYKKNSGGTISSGRVPFVESPLLYTGTDTWYSSAGPTNNACGITNVQIHISGSLISWTTNGVSR